MFEIIGTNFLGVAISNDSLDIIAAEVIKESLHTDGILKLGFGWKVFSGSSSATAHVETQHYFKNGLERPTEEQLTMLLTEAKNQATALINFELTNRNISIAPRTDIDLSGRDKWFVGAKFDEVYN